MTSTKVQAQVAEALSDELCPFNCGKPRHKGKRLCKMHLKHQRAKMAEYRAIRKKKKLCTRCPNPARKLSNGKPSTLCQDCRDHVRDLERAVVARRKLEA